MEEIEQGMKLPLDEHWYIRWDGNCFDLIEVRLPDPNSPLTKNANTPKHVVRAYCGSDLRYALTLYATKALAESEGIATAKSVLKKMADIEAVIEKVLARISG